MKKITTLFLVSCFAWACTKNSSIVNDTNNGLENPTLVCSDCGGIDPGGGGDGGSDDGKPKYAQQGCIIDSTTWGTKCISSPGTICTKTSSCSPLGAKISRVEVLTKEEINRIAQEHSQRLYKQGVITKNGIDETVKLVTNILQKGLPKN